MVSLTRRLAAACFVLLLVASCGSSDKADAPDGSRDSAAAESTTSTTSPTSTTTIPAPPAYRVLSEEELTGTLLGLEDLPAGYSQDPPEAGDTEKTFCDYVPPFMPQIEVGRKFTKGGGMSSEALVIGFRQFTSPDEARAAFDALTNALASCTGETYKGRQLTYAPMSAPKVGDASIGVKISQNGADLLQFFALAGPTLINTGGGGPLNASTEELTSLLDAQIRAYQTAAQG
jgi:hypothetical protein